MLANPKHLPSVSTLPDEDAALPSSIILHVAGLVQLMTKMCCSFDPRKFSAMKDQYEKLMLEVKVRKICFGDLM